MYRIVLALCLLPALVQKTPAQQQKEPPKEPTNLKVLKGVSGAEVSQIMRTFTAGLGVQCVYCHIQGNAASDENPKKETARHMIELMKLVNAQFPDKKMHVTCYTCHRGEAEPKTAPEPRTGGQ
jgi:hypothetical protein